MEYNGLTFKEFEKYLLELQDLCDFYLGMHKLFDAFVNQHGYEGSMHMPTPIDSVITLLSKLLKDRDEWIAYWVYGRDFGRNARLGTVTGSNGTVYPLDTPEHLWNLLAAERSMQYYKGKGEDDE